MKPRNVAAYTFFDGVEGRCTVWPRTQRSDLYSSAIQSRSTASYVTLECIRHLGWCHLDHIPAYDPLPCSALPSRMSPRPRAPEATATNNENSHPCMCHDRMEALVSLPKAGETSTKQEARMLSRTEDTKQCFLLHLLTEASISRPLSRQGC